MNKVIEIDGKSVGLCANALTPRIYRHKVGRDIVRDLQKLQTAATSEDGSFSVSDLEIFEDVAFIMARQYDGSIPDNVDEWLEQFEMFSIYEVLGELVQLWGDNLFTSASAKKNTPAAAGR